MTIDPLDDVSGTLDLTLMVQDEDNGSASQVLDLTILPVNDAPSFTAGGDVAVNEDCGAQTRAAWAGDISAGPNEDDQTASFEVRIFNAALFASGGAPAVSPAGELSFTPADDASGSATIELRLVDNGGTANGGTNASASQEFTITVQPVNDAPSFTHQGDVSVDEDCGAHTVSAWAGDISVGPANESTQGASFFIAGNTNSELFAVAPTIHASTGDLSFTPADDANGAATVTVSLQDDGGTERGGVGTSTEVSLTITVNAVNDPPAFTGTNVTVDEDAGSLTIADWATGISAGPDDESGQSLSFSVTVPSADQALFATQPSVVINPETGNGDLSFATAEDQNGEATITVTLTDGGDPAQSVSQDFTITIDAVNDAPVAVDDDLGPTTNEDTTAEIDPATLLTNDSDVDIAIEGDSLSVVAVAAITVGEVTTQGSVSLDSETGMITYDPSGAFEDLGFGEARNDVFAYTIEDVAGATATATVTVGVTGINDAPVIDYSDAVDAWETVCDEDTQNWPIDIPAGTDVDNGATLTWSNTVPPLHGGTLVFSGPMSGSAPHQISASYTPPPDWVGVDQFWMRVTDEHGAYDELLFKVIVQNLEDAPEINVASHAFTTTILEDGGAVALNGDDAINAIDPDGGQTTGLTWSVSQDAANGSVVMTTAQPGISPSVPAFTYEPATDYYGDDSFVLTVTDADGNIDTVEIAVSVTSVNDAPSLTIPASDTVPEGSGARSVADFAAGSVGPANESGQTLSYAVSVAPTDETFFAAGGLPAIASDGTLTYTLADDDVNGTVSVSVIAQDDGGTANGGVDASALQTFAIIVTAVNDAPDFARGADQDVLEDCGQQTVAGWASGMSAGPSDESDQSLSFAVTTDNDALFASGPSVASDGTLSFTPADDANGSATVTVTLSDNGGTANGGTASVSKDFTITVEAVNDQPSFTHAGDVSVDEDCGAQDIEWVTGTDLGPDDEDASQGVEAYLVSVLSGSELFAAGPSVTTDGQLLFTPAADAFGEAVLEVALQDDGGTANGGVDTSAVATVTITIAAVNDMPSFTIGADQEVEEDCGPQEAPEQATEISAGAANETDSLTFTVATDNDALFAVLPAIDADGTLTYTPADDAYGAAEVTVTLSDGELTTDPQTFTITVTPVNDAPSDILVDGQTQGAINENLPSNTTLGYLSVADADPEDVYTYELLNAAPFIIVGTQIRTNARFDHEIRDGYVMEVRATCSQSGDVFTDSITIVVNDLNEAPTDIVADGDLEVDENAAVDTLVGTLSVTDEDDGDTHSLAFEDGSTDDGQFKLVGDQILVSGPISYEDGTPIALSIVATDVGGLSTDPVAFSVSVNDLDEAPHAPAITGTSVDENAAIDTLVGTLSLQDDDIDDTHTWSFVAGENDNAYFALDGADLVVDAAIDFETVGSSLTVVVQATGDQDGLQLAEPFEISIDVNDVNEAPTDLLVSGALVNENVPAGTFIGEIAVTDEDLGQSHTVTLPSGVDDNDRFAIEVNEGVPSLVTDGAIDYETSLGSYTITLQVVDDGDPALGYQEQVAITVNDLNDPPCDLTLDPSDVDENTAPNTLVGVLGASDQDDEAASLTFTLDTDGPFALREPDDAQNPQPGSWSLVTAGAIDHENRATYECEVVANDGEDDSAPAMFTVTINDVNEYDPVIDEDDIDTGLDEDVPLGTEVATVHASDDDGTDVPQFAIISGNDDALFAIDAATGVITVAAALDYETADSHTLRVQATDRPGAGDAKTDAINVNIAIHDVNEAPVVADADFTIAETAENGDAVGTVDATDPDTVAGDTLRYAITAGDADGVFAIDASGTITVADSSLLAASDYELTVTVSDRADGDAELLSDTATITITVEDVAQRSVAMRVAPCGESLEMDVISQGVLIDTVEMTPNGDGQEGTAFPLDPAHDHDFEFVEAAEGGNG